MKSFADLALRILARSDCDLGAGVGPQSIAAAEEFLGVSIEGDYRLFLTQFGCGRIGHMELHGLGGPDHLDLVRVTLRERFEMEPALPGHLLPIMNDGGGNLYCLDTTVAHQPPVVFRIHTDEADQVPEVESESFTPWLWSKLDDVDDADDVDA